MKHQRHAIRRSADPHIKQPPVGKVNSNVFHDHVKLLDDMHRGAGHHQQRRTERNVKAAGQRVDLKG